MSNFDGELFMARFAAFAQDWTAGKWVKVGRICPTVRGAQAAAPILLGGGRENLSIWRVNGDGKPLTRIAARASDGWIAAPDYLDIR